MKRIIATRSLSLLPLVVAWCGSALQAQNVRFALLDLGGTGGRAEPGSSGGQIGAGPDGTNATNLTARTVTSDTGDDFAIAVDNVDAAGLPAGNVDWRDRGDHLAPEPLVRLGEDLVKNNAGILRVTLEGIPAGAYEVTSYHYDGCCDQANPISVFVDDDGGGFIDTDADGNGSLGGGGVDPLTTALMELTRAQFSFSSDGVSPVIILFDATTAVDTEVPLNGLDIGIVDPEAPIFSFSANPASILPGESADLAWEVNTAATSIVLRQDPGADPGDVSGDTDPATGTGGRQVAPAVSTTYTLEVQTPGGTDTAEATVTVALIASFEADQTTIAPGGSATLAWHVREDAAVMIEPDPGPIETVNGMGSVSVTPAATTVFSLTASAAGESDETVTVAILVKTSGGSGFAEPDGGWDATFAGDADPSAIGWDHNNGSDQWDGTGIGEGRPGGASVLAEEGVTFLRIQDPGDPGNDPSNRKIFFTKDLTEVFSPGYAPLVDGVTLHFRTRVATGSPLDDYHTPGPSPWPELGDGYSVHDGGKSVFSIRDSSNNQIVSFAPATNHTGPGGDYTAGEGLAMNRLVGTVASAEVDGNDAAGTANVLPLVPQDWQEVWVTIEADTSGGGTHRAEIHLNGDSTPNTFHLTAGTGSDQPYTYFAMGLGATPQTGAIDIDFFNVKEGVHLPVSSQRLKLTELRRIPGADQLRIKWESAVGKLYNLRSETDPSNGEPATWPVFGEHQDMAATPPENTVIFPLPPETARYFVVEEFNAPPVILFSDDLESGVGDWTTVVNDPHGNTQWELGTPAGTTGPLSGAGDSPNAWCTNLGDYGPSSDISLRTPPIDFSGVTEAELTFDAYRDADGFGDTAVVRFLRAADQVQLGADHPIDMMVFDLNWRSFRIPVDAEAIGESVLIEWNFVSDGSSDFFSGLSIDNVEVTD